MIIYKYQFNLLDGPQKVGMPAGAVVVKSAMQHGMPTIWAICDETEPKIHRTFRIVATGQSFSDEDLYVGTVLDGIFVWHILETELN